MKKQRYNNQMLLETILFIIILIVSLNAQQANWVILEKGLQWKEYESPIKSEINDNKIYILKADPAYFDLKLLSYSEEGVSTRKFTIEDWVKNYNFVAAINAGMYDIDYKSHVGFLKNFDHINNPVFNPKYNSVAAFNPVKKSLPSFRIFDVNKESFENVKKITIRLFKTCA